MRPVGVLAVRGIEIGTDTRVGVLDRGMVVIAGQGEVDRVVRGWRLDLPSLRIEKQRTKRVVADRKREADLLVEAHERLCLGL